ncbi:MAG TPA: hypothetical protein VNQ76_04130 [Planctomicrobium sp.]|nr:hypothetical protein [Planctomicrobium sp.]
MQIQWLSTFALFILIGAGAGFWGGGGFSRSMVARTDHEQGIILPQESQVIPSQETEPDSSSQEKSLSQPLPNKEAPEIQVHIHLPQSPPLPPPSLPKTSPPKITNSQRVSPYIHSIHTTVTFGRQRMAIYKDAARRYDTLKTLKFREPVTALSGLAEANLKHYNDLSQIRKTLFHADDLPSDRIDFYIKRIEHTNRKIEDNDAQLEVAYDQLKALANSSSR